MSRTSRARKLSTFTNIGHQQAIQHLDRLGLGIRDEKAYVNSLQGGGPVHRQTCACNREFFTPLNETACPSCAKVSTERTRQVPEVAPTTAADADVAAPVPTRDGWMQQHGIKSGGRAHPWRIFSPKRLPPGKKLSHHGYSWSSAWQDYFPSASWLDHSEVWMKDGRAVCVTGQPYVLDDRAREALALLSESGAVVYIHEPKARRSWHNPGNCYLVEVWRPALSAPPQPAKRSMQPRPPGNATVLASRSASKQARGTPPREPVHAVLFAHGRATAKSPFGRKGGMTVCRMRYPGASVDYLSLTDDAAAVTCPGCKAVLANGGWSEPDGPDMCSDCGRHPHECHLPRCLFVKMYGMRAQTPAAVE